MFLQEQIDVNKAKIRAFRAIDQPGLCEKYIEGHTRVLDAVGVKKVTSADHSWALNPATFVVLVESNETEKVLGGARLQAVNGIYSLPLEDGAGYMDNKIYDYVKSFAPGGVGEVCGLWNSAEVAAMGIGSIFLIRSALAISDQIGLTTMLALCSEYTTKIAGNYGFLVETSIGKNGTFYYPKEDRLATLVIQRDARGLSNSSELELERIMDLRRNPIQITKEVARKNKIIEMDYNVLIDGADVNEFRLKL